MTGARRAAVGLVLVAALVVAGCQSTQDKSAEIAGSLGSARQEKGLKITRVSRDVEVRRKALLNDRNGTAAVVELRNTGKRIQREVPIAIDVRAKGKSVFDNSTPGLEPSLVGVPVLRAGESIAWVHDQVFAPGDALKVKVGVTDARAPADLPRIEIGEPRLGGDPTSGIAAEGRIVNRSQVLQRKLVIHAVARKGDRIVAAGRGQVERLRPGRPASYQIFFIGDPRGARLELAAPPTTFR